MQAISAQNVRLRSANRGNAYNTWNVNTSGNVNNNNAYWANACAPIVITSVTASSCLAAVVVLLTNHKEPAIPGHTAEQYHSNAPDSRACERYGAVEKEKDIEQR